MNRIIASRFGAALTVALLMNLSSPARGADVYLSLRGADSSAGTSLQSAWQSLARLQKQPLRRGDRVLLEGDASFRGSLEIGANPDDQDDASNPFHLEIGSFGTGRATIDAAAQSAIVIRDRGGLVVRDLVLRGDGLATNRGAGLLIEKKRFFRCSHRKTAFMSSGQGKPGVALEFAFDFLVRMNDRRVIAVEGATNLGIAHVLQADDANRNRYWLARFRQ